jgi:hypothetical protein
MKGGSEMKSKKWGIYRIFVCIVLSVFVVLFATMGIAGEDACFYCGMKKAMFGHSWMDIERMDGSVVGVCSVHCAAIDMALHIDQPPKNIHVGVFNSKKTDRRGKGILGNWGRQDGRHDIKGQVGL